jgi:hypothetical protein
VFNIQTITLPRQARDKHSRGKHSKKTLPFSCRSTERAATTPDTPSSTLLRCTPVRGKTPPLGHLCINAIFLPRQARDKHTTSREKHSKKTLLFLCSSQVRRSTWPRTQRRSVRKTRTFCAVLIQERSFYQDRLGTNMGKAQKEMPFFLQLSRSGLSLA